MRWKLPLASLLPALALSAADGDSLRWSELPPLPSDGPAQGAFVAEVGSRLVAAGGFSDSAGSAIARAWTLDSPDAAWRPTTPLPEPAAFGAAAAHAGSAYFISGEGPGPVAALRVGLAGDELIYDQLPGLPGGAAASVAAVLESALYVIRGRAGSSTMWALALDTLGAEWAAAPAPPDSQIEPAALVAQDSALYLFGRDAGSGQPAALRYSPASGWAPIAALPGAPQPGAALPAGPTHIALRTSDQGGGIAAYHTLTDTWVDLGTMPAEIDDGGAAAWGGRLVFFGNDADQPGESPRFLAAELRPPSAGFSQVDYVTLIAYFAVLVMMGVYFSGKGSSTDDFFLAGRRMPWWATGLSIFGTQLSSISFMAIPAKVYSTDWVYFLLQLTIIMVAFPVVFFYLPHFRRAKMTSAYEYLEQRFNLSVRIYASVSFVLYQLGRMAIVLFLPAIALSTVTGISVYACIVAMGALATLYTVMGGIRAVIWTDVVQVFVLYGGALLSLGVLLHKTDGGLAAIVSQGLDYGKFHMFNWTWDWTTTAVWVVIVGNFFLNLVPYTSDQAVVQRYFTTKDEKAAAKSIWTNAALLVPSTCTLFLLGTGLWAFYRSNPELLNPTLPTDSIFPLFIAQQLPAGIAGLLIAAVFAASMSTLDSSLNSVSAALVTDFYGRFRPAASDADRLLLARLLTAGLGALATAASIALATFDIGSLWDTFQGMMGLLGGGLAGLFALGIFFRGANGAGAMTGAIASVLILYWVQQHTDLHFFLYGAVGILSCVLVGLAASPLYRAREA